VTKHDAPVREAGRVHA